MTKKLKLFAIFLVFLQINHFFIPSHSSISGYNNVKENRALTKENRVQNITTVSRLRAGGIGGGSSGGSFRGGGFGGRAPIYGSSGLTRGQGRHSGSICPTPHFLLTLSSLFLILGLYLFLF
ncbi:unnamed protein product [Amaranthus hypochondriacus]